MNAKVMACALLILGLFGGLVAMAQEVSPSPRRGQQTFMRVGCHLCHGTNGQGSGAGSALTPNTPSPEAIASFIRTAPGRMPAYPKEVLSDGEIADIVAFLRTVPPPPSVDSIRILRILGPRK